MTALRSTLIGICILAPAAGAAAQQSDSAVKAEIAFARGLAADWSFVDLADEVIRQVEDAGTSERMAEELGLVKCDVYAIGARRERDPKRRNELFEEALVAYQAFMDRNRTSESLATAEAAFVTTSANYARALDAALEEAVGEEYEALRTRQQEVLEQAANKTTELIEGLKSIPDEDRSEAESRQLYDLMLNRGRMYAEMSKAQEDDIFFRDQALKSLEDLVFTAGEGSPYALRAYVSMGDVYSYAKDYETATAYYVAVIEQAVPLDQEAWAALVEEYDPSPQELDVRFLFLELATGGAIDAYLNSSGAADSMPYALHFLNKQRQFGSTLSVNGYMSMLAVSRALLEAGGYIGGSLIDGEAEWFATEEEVKKFPRRERSSAENLSLRLAQTVNNENKGNTLQTRAQKLISEIISRPGVQPSPEILFEAAQGEYYDQNYIGALESFRRVLRAVDAEDRTTRLEYGAKVMNHIGLCYKRLNRPLEAAMAFREGVTKWLGDVEYDGKNAQGYYQSIADYAKLAAADRSALDALVAESEQIVANTQTAGGQDEVRFNLGKKAYRNGDYDAAMNHYREIPKGSDYYEKAVVEIGVCLYRKGDQNAAVSALDDFLDVYLASEDAASTKESLLARRREATATAQFYRAFILFQQADAAGDRAKYQKIVDYVGDFYRDFPEQTRLAPWTMQMVVKSQLGLDERAAARNTLIELVNLYPDDKKTGEASIQFYKALSDARDAVTDEEERTAILREMAEHLERSNDAAGSASFSNLRSESRHWLELGEWEKAASVLEKLYTKFGQDAEYDKQIRDYIIPDLGMALLEQGKATEAKAILDQVVLDEEARTSKQTLINWCRSVTGWLEGEGSDITAVPGATGATDEDFEQAVDKMNAIAGSGQSWVACDWYYHKFMVIYGYYVWGQQDSSKLESAKRQMATMVNETTTEFTYVEEWCSNEETEEELRKRFGGKVLQSYYKRLLSLLN